MLVRVGACIVALVACAWFVLGTRQAHDLAAATNIVTQNAPTAAQASHARSLLHSAATLNPDSEVNLVTAQLAFVTGDKRRALALAQAATRAEPRNILAWYELARVSGNGPSFAQALHEIRVLAPLVPNLG